MRSFPAPKWALAGLALSLLPTSARADVVTDWSAELLAAVKNTSANPPRASRAIAMVHLAIFEAVNGVSGKFQRYHVEGKARNNASEVAAAATAAHGVLSALFPTQVAAFDAQLAESLAGIPTGPRNRGIEWGLACAEDMLALRSADNAGIVIPYVPLIGPGFWQPTPPANAPALLPNWPIVTPFCLASGADLRSPPPPALTSAEYTAAFNEVKDLGRVDSSIRTPEQTQIAQFWADGAGTETPPGHWLRIAAELSVAHELSLPESARLLALVAMAVGDAAIVSWDTKYAYSHWRPVTGIRDAANDGNPDTAADTAWTSLIGTPPFPAYTSGHSTFSASAAQVLTRFFRDESFEFSTTSQSLAGVTRSFTSFAQAAAEAGQSRIYGGIHWQHDNQAGQAAGVELGDRVIDGFLRRIGDLNDDDRVTRADLAILNAALGESDSPADLDGDGDVDSHDRVILIHNLDR